MQHGSAPSMQLRLRVEPEPVCAAQLDTFASGPHSDNPISRDLAHESRLIEVLLLICCGGVLALVVRNQEKPCLDWLDREFRLPCMGCARELTERRLQTPC